MRPTQLINEAGRQKIESAVRAAEAGTSGEILVAVERSSEDYRVAPWRLAVLLGAGTALGSSLAFPGRSIFEVFVAQMVAVVLAHLLCRFDVVRRAFVSEFEFERSARLAATRAFTEHGMRRTRDRTGILIYVTLLEHRVVVLGDEAIDRALGADESWEQVVSFVLEGIRAQQPAEGIVRAVHRCGEILSHPLPARDDDENEIIHGLILGE